MHHLIHDEEKCVRSGSAQEPSDACALDPILESLVGAATVKFCCAAVACHVAAAHSAATPTRMVPRPTLCQLFPSVITASQDSLRQLLPSLAASGQR